MAPDFIGFDTFTLKGDPLSKAMAALRVARHQVRLAYDETQSWRLEMVLSEAAGVTELRFTHREVGKDAVGDIGPGWEFYLDALISPLHSTGGSPGPGLTPPTS